MENKKYPDRWLRHLISDPFIYMMIIPLIILDIFMTIYHEICFRLYRIPLIKRSEYIKIDRHKLKYLNWLDKIGCVYCGYANGLVHYALVIAGETEKYWCGIKHQKNDNFKEPPHHQDFSEYGDEKSFKSKYTNKEQ